MEKEDVSMIPKINWDEMEKQKQEQELAERKFSLELSKDQQRRDRIDCCLQVLSTLSEGYVSDMNLKNEATNLATRALIKELKGL